MNIHFVKGSAFRTLCILLLVAVAPSMSFAQSSCYARMEGDKLVLGNDKIERIFNWNEGNLLTVKVVDKQNEAVYNSASEEKVFFSDLDVCLQQVQPSDGKLTVEEMPATLSVPSYLKVVVSCRIGSLEVRREYRLYDGVPAIGCDTYLRSSGSIASADMQGSDKTDIADQAGIEKLSDLTQKVSSKVVLDRLCPAGNHWRVRAVEFRDITDSNNNLVTEVNGMAYRGEEFRGNLLMARDMTSGKGFFFLKEAPCSHVQIGYGGSDFSVSQGIFEVVGAGFLPEDLSSGKWIRAYSCALGVYGDTELDALKALRTYQKQLRVHLPDRDEMIMMNTWGDRGQDTKVNQQFCLNELELGSRLGITHFQIDDGWQSGKSPNSALANGSYKDIYKQKGYWDPDPVKFPEGLSVIVGRGRELGIEVGLWFAPSAQNEFEDWEKDAATLIGLYHKYGVRVFKVDGWTAPTKNAEMNFRRFVDKVMAETGGEVLLNMDSTAQRRGGYHSLVEYGNIFLENRYTDWVNYYPYKTLRNLWMLSKYVPAERLQVEFLNNWRNQDFYGDDPFAPAHYDFSYLFALTMAGQPLAWMEAANLPEEAFQVSDIIKAYKGIMSEFHSGIILPVGDEPSGLSWTGFQSILSDDEGFFIVYREDNPSANGYLKTWCPEGSKVLLTPVLGDGKRCKASVLRNGEIKFSLSNPKSFAVYRYKLVR